MPPSKNLPAHKCTFYFLFTSRVGFNTHTNCPQKESYHVFISKYAPKNEWMRIALFIWASDCCVRCIKREKRQRKYFLCLSMHTGWKSASFMFTMSRWINHSFQLRNHTQTRFFEYNLNFFLMKYISYTCYKLYHNLCM